MLALAQYLYHRIPGRMRERLLQRVGAAGHAESWAQAWRARRLAAGSKRLERVAERQCARLRQVGVDSLEGAVCAEFGCGHLLAEPAIYFLLGARRIYALDYYRILQPQLMSRLVRNSDLAACRRILRPWVAEDVLDARLRRLAAIDWRSETALEAMATYYVAPFDASGPVMLPERVRLIHSDSVMEHIPARKCGPVLDHLAGLLARGGTMAHWIHLEDHRDLRRAPFDFLAAGTDYRAEQADLRGNRLRASDWLDRCRGVPGCTARMVASGIGEARHAPRSVVAELADRTSEDLLTAWILIALDRHSADTRRSAVRRSAP